MSKARFRVTQVGPLVSIQDGGRFGYKRFGVNTCGAMDRAGFAAANHALGNPIGQTGVEISMGGLTLECLSGSLTYAIAGGGFIVEAGQEKIGSWTVRTIKAKQTLKVRAGPWGNWTYLAFAGDMQTKRWLGSASTHTASGFGGGQLKLGDEFEVKNVRVLPTPSASIPCPLFARPRSNINIVLGPQEQHFDPESIEDLQNSPFRLTSSYDRMGVRLAGPTLKLKDVLSIPSEPIMRGSIQVAGDGIPTVLLSDHQITGGYPKIATLVSSDIDSFTQIRPNQSVQFRSVTPEKAVELARLRARVSRR